MFVLQFLCTFSSVSQYLKHSSPIEIIMNFHLCLHVSISCNENKGNRGALKVKVKSSMARSLPVENLLPQNVQVNYQLLAVIYWSSPMEELPVAVDRNQLRTMASETEDPIDWSHPPPSGAVLPERLVHSINRCSLRSTEIDLGTSACGATSLPMRPLRVHDSGPIVPLPGKVKGYS